MVDASGPTVAAAVVGSNSMEHGPAEHDDPSCVYRSKVYSVPRRYDLATLFAVSAAYAVLFGAMRLFGFGPLAFGTVAGFLTCVAGAQALLFKGLAPRVASVLAGALLGVVLLLFRATQSIYSLMDPLAGCVCAAIWGGVLGYIAGVLVGAVFLFADLARKIALRALGGNARRKLQDS